MKKLILCFTTFILLLVGEGLISAKLLPILNAYSLYYGFILVLYAILTFFIVKYLLRKFFKHNMTLRFINFKILRTDLVLFFIIGLIAIIVAIMDFMHPSNPQFNLLVIINALTAGIFEEVIFRGGVLYILLKAFRWLTNPPLCAALVSSLIFGCAHLENLFFTTQSLTATLQQVFSAAILGLVCAIIYLRTGSLIYPMILHFLNDFVSFLSTNDLNNTSVSWFLVIISVGILLVLLIGVYLSKTNHSKNTVLLLQDF
ncbi:CPBP family intramembrane metalloprotease [Periweissella cryptocerci]|uniref:CPBP family intramembrane metalloprotease n=1 Tax=Periweissella cryptocerci TaxID=2506420 RepID=A0A4P6YTJ7_9LACO|nr:type II CAAX endopeptidase family protein [Periweissella cryptocerci]QBO35977.1 CPBP family intramembrane metalloprotease [Periweissella cryptocerci]